MNTLKKMELNIPSKVRGIYNQDLVHNTLDCIVSKELGQAEFWLANTINDDFNCEALFLRLNGKVICLTPETSWVSSENNEYIEIPVGMNIYDRIHSFYMLTTEMDNELISKVHLRELGEFLYYLSSYNGEEIESGIDYLPVDIEDLIEHISANNLIGFPNLLFHI